MQKPSLYPRTRVKSAIISFIRATFQLVFLRTTVYLSSLTHNFNVTNLQFLKKRHEIKGAISLPICLPRCPTNIYAEKPKIGVQRIAEETRSLTRRDRVTTPSLKHDLANKFAKNLRSSPEGGLRSRASRCVHRRPTLPI